jgi:hypothetical protein
MPKRPSNPNMEHPMTEANHSLHPRHVLVLARYRARQAVQLAYREAGRKLASVKPSQLTAEADAWIAEHPELLASCAQDLPRLGLKFKTGAQRKAR